MDFVKVDPLLTEYLGETGGQLPDLRRHRAVLGVNDDVARFYVGYPAMTRQHRRNGPLVESLKFQQASRLSR